MKEYPRVVIGGSAGCGKTLAKEYFLVREIRSYDGTSWDNLEIVKSLDKKLQKLSGNTIGTRIWRDHNMLHCVVVFPNKSVERMFYVDKCREQQMFR